MPMLENKEIRSNIPIMMIGAICLFLLIIFSYRSANLLFGSSFQAFLQPKTCVEFKVFKKTGIESLNNKVPAELNIVINDTPQLTSSIDNEILALKNECYYAKDVIALKESISQEESIAILAIFIPIFSLIMTIMSYYWSNSLKKEIEKIKTDSRKESAFFSKLLRRIEEVGARYSTYMIREDESSSQKKDEPENIHTAFDALQAGREIENHLLTLSNNSNSENGKTNIAFRSLAPYISKEDISNKAPYLLPLRDTLILIESQKETSDKARNSINHFIDFIEGNSPSFNAPR